MQASGTRESVRSDTNGSDGGADIQTEVDIENLFSLYARIEFTVDNPDDVLQAVLHMDYDDGFVAYLNGQEIARSFMNSGVPSFDTPASGLHEAMIYQGGEPEAVRHI